MAWRSIVRAVKWTGCQMSHGQLSGSQMSRGQMAAVICRGPNIRHRVKPVRHFQLLLLSKQH